MAEVARLVEAATVKAIMGAQVVVGLSRRSRKRASSLSWVDRLLYPCSSNTPFALSIIVDVEKRVFCNAPSCRAFATGTTNVVEPRVVRRSFTSINQKRKFGE